MHSAGPGGRLRRRSIALYTCEPVSGQHRPNDGIEFFRNSGKFRQRILSSDVLMEAIRPEEK